jgi:hypothetical protein
LYAFADHSGCNISAPNWEFNRKAFPKNRRIDPSCSPRGSILTEPRKYSRVNPVTYEEPRKGRDPE